MKKFELKIVQKLSINVDNDFNMLYFFFENNRIILVSYDRIIVYFWTKTLA